MAPIVELSPIPGASTKGILANKAINKVPIALPRAVAKKTDENLGSLDPSIKILLGFTVKIYITAKNVVNPAINSIFILVLFSFNLNIFSNFLFILPPNIILTNKIIIAKKKKQLLYLEEFLSYFYFL